MELADAFDPSACSIDLRARDKDEALHRLVLIGLFDRSEGSG